jgi:5-methylcytosine-specific restriction enzyme subunit McrC
LLRSALERVLRATGRPDSWRLAQELALRTAEVRPSARERADFEAWQEDRLMAHYAPIKPWCELVLGRQMPWALAGGQSGISLLFPMEKLFERFVARWLRKAVVPRSEVKTPARSEWLCRHEGSPLFRLEPDLLVELDRQRWVMDTKWKGLDVADRAGRFGLAQSDLYQLFAYGQRYLGGVGQMALIYPRTATFQAPFSPFDFGGGLNLHVLPFDLDQEQLLGLEELALPMRSSHFPVAMAG